MSKNTLFSYYWFVDEKEEEVTSIRVYGLGDNNENICLRITDFTPYIYLELPTNIEWNETKAQLLGDKLDTLMKKRKPIKKSLIWKYKLYGASVNKDGNRKKFPFLFCSFSTKNDIKMLSYEIKKRISVNGVGTFSLKMHEQDADPILQLVTAKNIPTAGWITFAGDRIVSEDEKITLCDLEYKVKWKNMKRCDNKLSVGKPKIMGFDIEVNSSNPSAMPKAVRPGDKIFQISCVFSIYGSSIIISHLLSLGEPLQESVGNDVIIHTYKTEADLLIGFTELIRKENPNIIVGYNILGFDIPYMIDRAKSSYTYSCLNEFDKMGFHKYLHAKEKIIKWSSSAYKNQEFQFLDAEGRLFVDLLPLIKRDYKMDNYRLNTVSEFFLGDKKDDLSVKGIFKCYRVGTKKEPDGTYSHKARKAMGICGHYCLIDSVLVVKLMEKLQTWIGLTEMATVCNTSIFSLYTQGQQIKVYSQVYKYCYENNFVVEKDGYIASENERYIGAHVFPPVPGIYDRVLPFDFCLSGDTLVNLSNGLSKRIDNFDKDKLVLGFNKKSDGFEHFSFINGLQKKGVKDTVKIYFQDGSSIIATPEHKFMLENGEWCQAKDLKNKYVKAGIKFPEDKTCDLEEKWKLELEGYVLNMKNDEERDKSLAFARMIGYILADGSIYESTCKRGYIRKYCEACFGTMYDALTFKRDINLFSDVDVVIRKRDGGGNVEREKKGTTLSISIPSNLSKMFHSLEDIVVGKRATQEMKLPKFVLEDNCPLSIIREFLGGLFGGDGTAPCLCKNDRISDINFKWTTIKNYINEMNIVFRNIQKLLEKFDIINTSIHKPLKINYKENAIKPNERYDIQLNITIENIIIFSKKIGFRYCINKLGKSHLSSIYLEMKERTRIQRLKVLDRVNELIDKKGNTTFSDCLELSRTELLTNEPALYSISLSSTYDLTYDRHERIRHKEKNRKYSLHKKKFPSPSEYFKNINAIEWFNHKYLIKTDDTNIPSFKQKVIDVREHEPIEVFDIEVDNVHNFIANGITTKNCSLYPSTIIAYNLDYSTLVTDDDIPDSKCNIFTWRDCVSCQHDPKVIRKNELTEYIEKEKKIIKTLREKRDNKLNKTNRDKIVEELNRKVEELKPYTEERSKIAKTISKYPMCEERHYRFLKEPKGVIPTILENLLNARKNTRKEIKKHKAEISEMEDLDTIKNLKLLNNVLDKRQLAYKISANSMYGSWGVRKGYLPFMPGAMCLESNSLISYSYGFTRKIKDLVNTDSLWSYNNGQVISKGNGLIYNGKREVVKITLIDGRTLRCTPDHKIMTTNGWVEAGKLLSKKSKVFVGLELPEDIICEDEKNWKILEYTMDTPNNREKTLAFCRILGFKNNKLSSRVDAHIFSQDIKLITGEEPKITTTKYDTFIVDIPKILEDQISLLYISSCIPPFLLEEKCPLSVVREFLGGLYGNESCSQIDCEKLLLRFGIELGNEYDLKFARKIGFRYSSSKNNKLTLLSSYQRYIEKQYVTLEMYIKMVGYENENELPCLYLDVVDVRYDGIEDVYDIIDVPEHSFIANGIVVHNCTTFMGRTNIEIVAKTIQEKYGGELVYGD